MNERPARANTTNRGLGRLASVAPLAALCVLAACPPAFARPHPAATFVVDGVHVNASGADLQGLIVSSAAGNATQETTIVDRAHGRVVSVIAAPFGTRPGIEDELPLAARGGAAAYRSALHDYRARTGEFASDAPPIRLFGKLVPGDVSQRTEHASLANGHQFERDAFTTEWVAEAGPRLWIVRVREVLPTSHALGAVSDFEESLSGLTIWSDGSIAAPTTVTRDRNEGAVAGASFSPDQSAQLRWPSGYSGACDAENYDRASGRTDWRNQLGATFRGIAACGPRPATGAPLIAAAFVPGSPPALFQFDAPELALRWMWLAYGTPPYSGNGDQLVGNYDPSAGGQPLYRYANVAGSAVRPQAGDVLSYDTGGTGGHASVVVATHVDAHGNGWLDVIEQDASVRGFGRLQVLDGEILSAFGGPVFGWLSPRPSH